MKHPLSEWLGGDSTLVIHRPVMFALRERGAPRPMEMAALLEHLTFLHRYQKVDWVTCPYDDLERTLLIEERTARNYVKFLKDHGLLQTRRSLTEYKGQVSPFLQYQVQAPALAEMLGLGGGAEKFSGSVPTSFSGSSSIQRNSKGREKFSGRNAHFDALATGLYGHADTSKLSDAKQVGIVAAELKRAGWTPDDIHHVLSAVKRQKFWKTADISPFTVRKYGEAWRARFLAKEEERPPVVPDATTPDDLDWTTFEDGEE